MTGEFRDTMAADLFRYTDGSDASAFRKCLKIPGFRYTYCLRRVQWLRRSSNPLAKLQLLLWGYLLRKYRYRYGFDIPAGTSIGPGLYLGHFGQVVINPSARIGSNVNINPGVAIGATRASTGLSTPGVPTVGNRVWIGTNAVVVGNVTIGDDVLIAPGAYVYFDVPPLSVVRGNPGKVIDNDVGSRGYVNRVWEQSGSNASEVAAERNIEPESDSSATEPAALTGDP